MNAGEAITDAMRWDRFLDNRVMTKWLALHPPCNCRRYPDCGCRRHIPWPRTLFRLRDIILPRP